MRQTIISVGLIVIAAQAWAETPPAKAAESTTPPLTTTVKVDPNDSPMVRAAKKAVASRVHPNQRRVISLSSSNTRGRVAFATGPTEAPRIPPPSQPDPDVAGQERQRASVREVARIKAAAEKEKQDKLKQLANEQKMLGAEMDEPYGGDIEEDAVEKRMYDIEAERNKAQQTNPPPPPSRP